MPSTKAVIAAFASVAVIGLVVVALFLWPGFLTPTSCAQYAGPTQILNGRSYCAVPFSLPAPHQQAPETNQSIWGYHFQMEVGYPANYGLFTDLYVTIAEPNGTSSSGALPYLGPPGNETWYWFTPDNQSGVSVEINSEVVTLLVIK